MGFFFHSKMRLELTLALLKPDLCMRVKAKKVSAHMKFEISTLSVQLGSYGNDKREQLLCNQTSCEKYHSK